MNCRDDAGRRRLRAGLTALLLLAAAGCGEEQDPDRRAARRVLDTGGWVAVLADGEERHVASPRDLPGGPLQVRKVGWADYPGDDFAHVTDDDLIRLEGLTGLTELSLAGTAVTDQGLARLAGMEQLTNLSLNETGIGDAGLEHLAGLKNLTDLGLVGVQVSPAAVQKLQQELPRLKIRRG